MKLVATIGINWMHVMRQDCDGLYWLGRRHLDVANMLLSKPLTMKEFVK